MSKEQKMQENVKKDLELQRRLDHFGNIDLEDIFENPRSN